MKKDSSGLIVAFVCLMLVALFTLTPHAQMPVPKASILVRYPGMSWAGGGRPVSISGIVVQRSSPECRLTATEQRTLTCANLWAVDAMTDIGVDGVIVHLSGEGITSDIFKSIHGGLVQMRVKQAKRYTVKVDQPMGYMDLSKSVRLYGIAFQAGSDIKGPKTSDLLVLQLWPK